MTLPPPPDPDCDECGGTGFIILWDNDGEGLHDEDNCPVCRPYDGSPTC